MIRAENPKKIAIALPMGGEASQSPENTPQNCHSVQRDGGGVYSLARRQAISRHAESCVNAATLFLTAA
ncbi:hypothetical protein [Shinella sp.]|uniref:hypothetical protein n=1 Tax=Shinella sp. TaxID=1870904 RepID=UPI004035F8D1